MASIGQTTLKTIRLTLWLLEADELIGIFQGRISIRSQEKNLLLKSRRQDCSRSSLSTILISQKYLTPATGPYMRLK